MQKKELFALFAMMCAGSTQHTRFVRKGRKGARASTCDFVASFWATFAQWYSKERSRCALSNGVRRFNVAQTMRTQAMKMCAAQMQWILAIIRMLFCKERTVVFTFCSSFALFCLFGEGLLKRCSWGPKLGYFIGELKHLKDVSPQLYSLLHGKLYAFMTRKGPPQCKV